MKLKEKIQRLFIMAVAMVSFQFLAFAETEHGEEYGFGWVFDTETNQLVIEGSGELNSTIASDYQSRALKLVIGEGITSISNKAFQNCTILLDVTLPSTIIKIENKAFSNSILGTIRCKSNNPPEIHQNTFNANKIICVVFVPEGSRKLYTRATYWKDFDGIYQGEEVPDELSGNCGDNVVYKLKPGDWTLSITGTGDMCNSDYPWSDYNPYIYKININEGITNIGNGLCSSMTRLDNIDLPSTIISIGDNAFANSKITSISLPSGLKYIGKYAFSLSKIKSLMFPEEIEKIDEFAFFRCPLETVTFSSSLQTIGASAFEGTQISTLTIPNSIISIGKSAFSNCPNLKKATLSENISIIPAALFYNCSELVESNIPTHATTISSSAYCKTALSCVSLPASVISIGDNAFANCKSLKECSLNEGLLSIGNSAFNNCNNLESLRLPSSLQTIESGAFSYSGISTISIPDDIISVGDNVFGNYSANIKLLKIFKKNCKFKY